MVSSNNLTLNILGNPAGLRRSLMRSRRDLRRFGGAAKEVGRGAALALGGIGTVLAARGIGSILGGLSAGISGASDFEESLSKVRTILGDSAGVVERFAENAVEGIGQTRAEALAAVGDLANLFTGLGQTDKAAADNSVTFLQLATDLGSFNNVPTPDALLAIRSGLVGEAEPLRRFGILLSAAQVENKALELGLVDTKSEITEQIKVQARMALILEQTTTAQGDFTRTSDGAANSLRIQEARQRELSNQIGESLLPLFVELKEVQADVVSGIADRMIPVLREMRAWWEDNRVTIRAALEQIGAVASEWLGNFVSGLQLTLTWGRQLFDFIIGNKAAMVAAIAAVGVAIALALGPVGVGTLAIVGAIALIGRYRDNMELLRVDVLVALAGISDGFVAMVGGVGRALVQLPLLFLEIRNQMMIAGLQLAQAAGNAIIGGLRQVRISGRLPKIETPFGTIGGQSFDISPFGSVPDIDLSGSISALRSAGSGLASARAAVAERYDAIVAPLIANLRSAVAEGFAGPLAEARAALATRQRADAGRSGPVDDLLLAGQGPGSGGAGSAPASTFGGDYAGESGLPPGFGGAPPVASAIMGVAEAASQAAAAVRTAVTRGTLGDRGEELLGQIAERLTDTNNNLVLLHERASTQQALLAFILNNAKVLPAILEAIESGAGDASDSVLDALSRLDARGSIVAGTVL